MEILEGILGKFPGNVEQIFINFWKNPCKIHKLLRGISTCKKL